MEPDKTLCGSECICEEAGHCPCYGVTMNHRLHDKCKRSQGWRDNFTRFFISLLDEEFRARSIAKGEAEMEKAILRDRVKRSGYRDLDDALSEIESSLHEDTPDAEGLGDLVESVFTKFGITSERIGKALGTADCGCNKRKQFLNQLFPFMRKNDKQKKEDTAEEVQKKTDPQDGESS